MTVNRIPVIDRLLSRVVIGEPPEYKPDLGPCWIWMGNTSSGGYGRIQLPGSRRSLVVHRVSYEHFVGPIPEGLQLDHLCRVRNCVNPEHLEAVTGRVNTLRGDTMPARSAAATHCPHGHPYDDENTGNWQDRRVCITCHRARQKLRDSRRVQCDVCGKDLRRDCLNRHLRLLHA